MKPEINLLPPIFQVERQKKLYLSRVGRILRRVDGVLVVIVLVLAVLFGAFNFLLQDLEKKNLVATHQDARVAQEITEVNAMVDVVQVRGVANQAWTPYVKDLMMLLPATVQLTSLTGDATSNILTVSGTFSARPAVVQYEQALLQLPWVAKVESPLQNLASGSNTEFTMTITRKQPML